MPEKVLVMKPESIMTLEKELGFELSISPTENIPKIPGNSYCLDEDNKVIALFISTIFEKAKDEFKEEQQSEKFDFLKDLTHLATLRLFGQEVEDISFLKNLVHLKFIELDNNKIANLSPLNNLKKLEYLDLRLNEIQDITALKDLTELRTLNLSDNLISDISPLKDIANLRVLLLRENKISEVPFTMNFNKLEHLDLSHNQITGVEFLKNLTALITLGLRDNHISDITQLLKLTNLRSVALEENKKIVTDFPSEVLKAGWDAVKQFSEESKDKAIFKNVKVLLLGNPNIGKSNLLEYFETNQAPTMDNATHGVQYKQLQLKDIDFHIWDFGGQEYFHATHQLFFSSNAINIVMWGQDIARQKIQEACFELDYWMRTITQLNGNSQELVLLTENKIDLNNPKYSENKAPNSIYQKFDTLTIYESHISLMEVKNMEGFKEKFFNVAELVVNKFKYPKFYEVFWKRLTSLDKDFATIKEINSRPHQDNVITAAKVFHNMGMLLYFENIIPDKIFHKPQILLDLLYNKVLSAERNIKITTDGIEEALSENLLGLTSLEVIALLNHFNLVFQLDKQEGVYFIPQYLRPQSKTQKLHEELGFSLINIKIKADHYLMSLAMLKIFSKYGNYVDSDHEEYLFWHNGIIIFKDNQNLLIKYIAEKQTIELYTSNKSDNNSLQKEIVDFILDLPEDMSFPKRNFENHKKKRWVDVMNEDDIDFAPHFSERIQEYPGYLEEFENRNWENGYRWESSFFDVEVSVDGTFFIDWRTLKKNSDLSEINFVNEERETKKIKDVEYCYLIDKKVEKNKEEKMEKIITYNFNAPVNGSIIGDNNHIETQTTTKGEDLKASPAKGFSDEEIRVVERWKLLALLSFLIYLLISAFLSYIYVNETEFIMSKIEWQSFKDNDFSKILILIWSSIGVYLIYKIMYDRFFDPSKENAYIDLHRKRRNNNNR